MKNVLKRLFCYVLVMMSLVTSFPISMTYAAKECSEEYLRDIQATAVNCAGDQPLASICAPTGITQVEGSDNAMKTWNFFRSQGLEPHQAAGFMGNMQDEAHFEPRLVEYNWPNGKGETSRAGKPSSLVDDIPPSVNVKGQPGYGIIQWTAPDRKRGLQTKVDTDSTRRKAGDLTLQLEYMWQELNTGYKKSTLDPVRAAGTVEESTAIVANKYEIPGGNRAKKIASRTQNARGFLVKYGSLTPATPAPAPTTTEPTTGDPATPGSVIDIAPANGVDPSQSASCQTGSGAGPVVASPNAAGVAFMAIYYAWPEGGHGLTPKPEYAAGIRHFNPKANLAGADCGAFVGTVMHASGADKSYPLGGTSAQMDYVKKNPAKYDVTTNFTVADLLPGDILIVVGKGGGYGHTYIFVGDQGAGRNKADASVGKRMPNLGSAEAVDKSRGHYTRARLKVQ